MPTSSPAITKTEIYGSLGAMDASRCLTSHRSSSVEFEESLGAGAAPHEAGLAQNVPSTEENVNGNFIPILA